jgi:hypothetical protein
MPRVVKRSASQALGPSRRDAPLPALIPPQLSQPVEKPPSGPQWVHEIKLDRFRMAAHRRRARATPLGLTEGKESEHGAPPTIHCEPGLAHPFGPAEGCREKKSQPVFMLPRSRQAAKTIARGTGINRCANSSQAKPNKSTLKGLDDSRLTLCASVRQTPPEI